jgi:effector-binding domain-containing protein
MKALKYFFFLLLIFTIGSSIYIAVQPNSFDVSRTRIIKAPAAVIYNNVIDFKNWEAWSSWAEANPDFKMSLSEQTKGVNGALFWEDEDGVGTMKTIEATPFTSIQQEMQISDFPSSNVNWKFNPNEDGSTEVTWQIIGTDLPFLFKMFTVINGDMEKQIGPHYERSLEKLDSIVVSDMKKYSVEINGITEHSGGFYIYNSTSCKINDLKNSIDELLPKVKQYAEDNNIDISGFPYIYYHSYDVENNAVMFSCCIPTTSRVITTEPDILTGQLYPFKTLKTTLKGDYINLKEAWDMSMKYITNSGNTVDDNGPMLEVYSTDSSNVPNPADWKTEIYIALKD